jgi:MFS family permease
MTQTASLWLVYHLSSSPFQLGLVGFAGQFPIFLFGALSGVVADRVNRHKLLVWTQALSMAQSLTLAGFAFTDSITVTGLVILMFIQGVVNAFDMPARQTMVVEFVERKEHLGNAIALNSSLFNLTRLAGPTVGGFVIAFFGGGTRGSAWCYLIDGISYGATIVALLMMRLPPRPPKTVRRRAHTEFREGLHYVMGSPPIRALILLVAAVSAIGFFCAVLTPVFAKDIFHGDAQTQGWMMSGAGAGAVLGSLYLGTRKTVHGLGNVITIGGLAMAVGLVGLGLSRVFPLSLLCLGFCGMGACCSWPPRTL